LPVPSPTFVLEPDAPPFVRGVAATLKRSASQPKLAARMCGMKGVLALRSTTDQQAATVTFERGLISLVSGVSPDAGLVIALDPADPTSKPKVTGAVRHPRLALSAAKVLEPPTGTWQQEASEFWSFASSAPRMPDRLEILCTDDGSQLALGAEDGSVYEIQGSAEALVSLFSGNSIFGEDLLNGKLLAVGSFEHASVFTGRSIAWVMGKGR
jgi:hypothetical protein